MKINNFFTEKGFTLVFDTGSMISWFFGLKLIFLNIKQADSAPIKCQSFYMTSNESRVYLRHHLTSQVSIRLYSDGV